MESAQAHGCDGCFSTTGDDDVGIVILDGLHRVTHSIGGAGTCGGNGVVGPAQAVANREIASGGVEHQLGDREWANAVGTFAEQAFDLDFDFSQATIPEPRMTPVRYGSSLEKSMPES